VALEQKLSLRLSQRLVMTPTLQQAIKLLQMTRLELQDIVNQEMVSNPVLEEQDPEEKPTPDEDPSAAEARERDRTDESAGETSEGPAAEPVAGPPEAPPEAVAAPELAAPQPVVDPTTPAAAEAFQEIDLEAFFGDYMEGTATAPRMTEEAEEFSLENRAEPAPGLEPHLTEQLGVSDAPPGVREACGYLIGNVDPDGYLRVTLEEASAAVPCTMQEAERALALLQTFDPVGVGGRNLPEVLLLQARAANVATPLLVELVTSRLPDVGTKAPALLARQIGVPLDELKRTIDWIKRFDPKPGRRYDQTRTIYIEPDVAVAKVKDDYAVVFNDDGLPRLRVSALYRRMLQTRDASLDGESRNYLREKMRAAQWLLKSLDQRKRTIVRVAESIVRKQRDFFDYGVAHLKPLVLRDVAEDIGMHESTVSRVVSNKWMTTPRGLVPMKFFFHSAIASSAGEDVSSLAVKNRIQALVEAEDPGHPLSDARLSELLARDGIRIARRTVAKYREELRIPSSSLRRTDAPAAEPLPVGAGEAGSDGPSDVEDS
jgi:RNA polymerase sigma-54 factor